jgi:hypothetical protein
MITYLNLGNYGRLGNQLFQIASTIGIAVRNNTSYGFPMWRYTSQFDGNFPIAPALNFKTYKEDSPYYREINLDTNYDWNLDGYFQSWKYFDHCKDLILDTFRFNHSKIDRIAIHVRRGDYVQLQHVHPILKLDYYWSAMEYFKGEKFTVFSDDIQWCISNLPKKNVTYSTAFNLDPIEDFKQMSSHKGFIIANSSFSWWAAYLSESRNVVAPSRYVIGEDRDDRIPPEWTKI